jgi:hypothetical protein
VGAGAPHIDKFPKSQFASISGGASFTCHITCDPPPKVTWSKNGEPVVENDNLTLSVAEGQYTLTLKNIQKSDGGDYTIVASNDHGELSCTASLFVTGEVTEGMEESEEEYESETGSGVDSDDESE